MTAWVIFRQMRWVKGSHPSHGRQRGEEGERREQAAAKRKEEKRRKEDEGAGSDPEPNVKDLPIRMAINFYFLLHGSRGIVANGIIWSPLDLRVKTTTPNREWRATVILSFFLSLKAQGWAIQG